MRMSLNYLIEYFKTSSDPSRPWHTEHPYPTSNPLQTLANLAAVTQTYGGDAASIVALDYILAKAYETLGENPSVEDLYEALKGLKVYCDCEPGEIEKWNVRDKKNEMVKDLEKCTCTCVQKAVFDAKGGLHGGEESKATNSKVNRYKKFLCVQHPSHVP